MHSSRMRTGHSLTACRSLIPGGGGCLLLGGVCSGGDGVCSGGMVSAPGGAASGGVSAPGGVCFWGVSAPGGCLLPGGIPACTEADPPTVNRITDTSKNITLATTSLRPVKTLITWIVFGSHTNLKKPRYLPYYQRITHASERYP